MRIQSILVTWFIVVVTTVSVFAGGGGETRSDETIKQNVVEQLVWDNRVDASQIKVGVDNRAVTLSGSVKSLFVRDAAVDDTWTVEGVIAVEDDLIVEPVGDELRAREILSSAVRSALIVDTEVDARNVSVTAEGSEITIEGTVDSFWEKLRAEEIASGVGGVAVVNNQLAVVPTESVVDDEIATDIVSALERNSSVNAARVDVVVEAGVVSLSGEVVNWAARNAAVDAATATLGVVEVVDGLRVDTAVAGESFDEEIAEAVRDQLVWDSRIDSTDIAVLVDRGVVTLTGTVASLTAKEAAGKTALTIGGVVAVENSIDVVPPLAVSSDTFLERRAEDALTWSSDVQMMSRRVWVEAGVATIHGQVDSLWERRRAEEIVENVDGVIDVTNEIAVVPTENTVDQLIAEDIIAAIDRNLTVSVDDVTVTVENGAVTLSGDVPSEAARTAAFDAAVNTTGVQAVIDNMDVIG